MLGFITEIAIPTTVVTSGGTQVSLSIPVAGIYLATYSLLLSGTTQPTSFQSRFQGGGAINSFVGGALLTNLSLSSSQSQIIDATATTISIIISYSGGVGLSMGGPPFKIVRIG